MGDSLDRAWLEIERKQNPEFVIGGVSDCVWVFHVNTVTSCWLYVEWHITSLTASLDGNSWGWIWVLIESWYLFYEIKEKKARNGSQSKIGIFFCKVKKNYGKIELCVKVGTRNKNLISITNFYLPTGEYSRLPIIISWVQFGQNEWGKLKTGE